MRRRPRSRAAAAKVVRRAPVVRPRSRGRAQRVHQVVGDVDAVQALAPPPLRRSRRPRRPRPSSCHGLVAQPLGVPGHAPHRVPGAEQLGHEPAADVPGGTCHEHAGGHTASLPRWRAPVASAGSGARRGGGRPWLTGVPLHRGHPHPRRSNASFIRSRMARVAGTCWSGAALAVTRTTTASPLTLSTPA